MNGPLHCAISDLAALRPNWTLLADTFPAEFLRQVKGEVESLSAERDAALAELAALKAEIAACFKCHADACGGGKYSCLDFAVEQENLKPGWYALYPVPAPKDEEEVDA